MKWREGRGVGKREKIRRQQRREQDVNKTIKM
jgi:hypothetical protein